MRLRALVTAASAARLLGVATVPADAAADKVLARCDLNEASGAHLMMDSSGNGFNGFVGDEVETGVVFGGATGYRFDRLTPDTPPAHPEHNVITPHKADLNPNGREYTVEVRYRTTDKFGNLAQKGQATSPGGYWKIQLPKGEPSCLFRGPGV